MKYISHSAEETEKIACDIAKNITPPRVLCLIGDLGAGKTAFTRGFARAYGIDKGVSSPTFTLMHRYDGTVRLNHYDLYRLSDFDELLDIGFEEDIENGISLIEWADDFMDFMPSDRIVIRISRTGGGDNERIIEVTE
ncbi:MAG: tRNA (adenosine(37)-N6)-threonylcarbamoyltransferase complex ATPase subunit type 1 TsaE [Clostridia bacterium]